MTNGNLPSPPGGPVPPHPPGGITPQPGPPPGLAPKKKHSTLLIVIGVIVALAIIGGIIGSTNKKSTEKKTETQVEEESAVETTPAATTSTTPPASTSPPSTEAQLQTAVGSGLGTVTYDPTSQTATVTQTDNDPFGPTEVIRAAYKNFVQFGQKAVNVPGINTVCAIYVVPFDDQYGKKVNDTAVRLVMPTSEFVKFDWKALEYQPISDRLQASCTEYYIHPALAGTRPSDLFLEDI